MPIISYNQWKCHQSFQRNLDNSPFSHRLVDIYWLCLRPQWISLSLHFHFCSKIVIKIVQTICLLVIMSGVLKDSLCISFLLFSARHWRSHYSRVQDWLMRRRYVLFNIFRGELVNDEQIFTVTGNRRMINAYENFSPFLIKILVCLFFQSAYVVTPGTRMVGAIFCAGSPLLSFWLFLWTSVVLILL